MRFDTKPADAPMDCPETVLYLEGHEHMILINPTLEELGKRSDTKSGYWIHVQGLRRPNFPDKGMLLRCTSWLQAQHLLREFIDRNKKPTGKPRSGL